MLLLYHVWTPVLVSVFETRNWTNFEEFKTLQHVLLLELNLVKAILAASRITYNIQCYSYFFQDSCRTFFGLFVVPVTIISSTTKSLFILQITFTVPHCELCDIRWQCVFLCAPTSWNTLPDSLKNADLLSFFQSAQTETFLFRKL